MSKQTKMKLLILIPILLVGVITIFWLNKSNSTLKAINPESQTKSDQFTYLTSDEFQKLPESEKIQYIKKIKPKKMLASQENLSPKQKEQLLNTLRPVFRKMRKKQIKKYFQLKTSSEKEAFLDKRIDEKVDFWKTRAALEKDGKSDWRKLSRIKERIETSDPKERAQWMEFRMAMSQRMKDRNITPPWRR